MKVKSQSSQKDVINSISPNRIISTDESIIAKPIRKSIRSMKKPTIKPATKPDISKPIRKSTRSMKKTTIKPTTKQDIFEPTKKSTRSMKKSTTKAITESDISKSTVKTVVTEQATVTSITKSNKPTKNLTKSKKKTKQEISETYDFMKTNKDNIKNVIRDTNLIRTINEIVIRTNKIVIHAYNFLKLYILDLYTNNKEFPIIDKEFIMDIFKVITQRKSNAGNYAKDAMPLQRKTLQAFYDNHYKQTVDKNEVLYYDKLCYILPYEAIDMTTNITNNIQAHYMTHLNKFVNVYFDVKKKAEEITKKYKDKKERKQLHNELYKEFRQVKTDLINLGELKSKKKYHKWIRKQKKFILPEKSVFDQNSVLYDLKSNTMDYLKSFIYINTQLEKFYDCEETTKHKIRLFNILPLRKNIVPKNIVFDTAGLIQNLINNESQGYYLTNYKKEELQYDLWDRVFKLNKGVFKKGKKYSFHHMIRTDGVSVCVLFVRNKVDGIPMKKCPINVKSKEEATPYIENVVWTPEMLQKRVVTVDPGLSDLLYCGSKNKEGDLETFRYTQNQRRLETRVKKYSKIMNNLSKHTEINDYTVKEFETRLCRYNSKTCNYAKFKEYVTEKNKLNILLFDHYSQYIYRKFKLNRFTNTQKSENKLIKNFQAKFGEPKDVLYIMGDYDKGHQMRGTEPSICKKFRRIFRNAGYSTYLINEFRTSKLCNGCHNELEPFLYRPSQKPKRKGEIELCFGLLQCTTVKPECELIHNRDKNAVQNMLYIVDELKRAGKRPKEFTRETAESI